MNLDQIDLTDDDTVMSAGTLFGQNVMDELKKGIMGMDMERRVLFFTAFLTTPVLCMKASIGLDATLALLDVQKEQASGHEKWKRKDSH